MFKHLYWNEEVVCVGDAKFKFYHWQHCPFCGYNSPGYNDLKFTGPWDFTCQRCKQKWSVVMTEEEKQKRGDLMATLHQIDFLTGVAKTLRETY